jgi:hypothetical protein
MALPVASKRGDQRSEGHAGTGTGEAMYDTAGVNTSHGRTRSPRAPLGPTQTSPQQKRQRAKGVMLIDRRERGLTERLVRYYATCHVEIPECENQRALEMLASWFGERTMEWVTDECIQAGIIMSASEAGMPTALGASIPRRTHGPREEESLLAPQTSPPTMDIWLDWATIQFRFIGPNSGYTGSFCVFGPVLSSPAHGAPSLPMAHI